MAADLRELTFQNVVDTVLNPAGVKMGGFPEEIFTDLTDDEKEEWSCNICFLILKDTRHCDNKHQFCHTCIFAWSLTLGENSGKCPVCRCKQKKYTSHTPVDQLIEEKRVKCPETGCSFASPLKILLMHSHGKLTYSNANIDLESLRPPPQQMLMYAPLMHHPLRQQLSQGRMMINQMLLLLQLEMQLRQHALFNFTHSTDHSSRMHHADEMVALNEQLGEVGGIIGSLLNSSIDDAPRRRAARNRAQQADGAGSGESEGAGGGAATGRRIPRSDLPRVISFLGADNDALDSDSDSSGEGATSRLPTRSRVQLPSTRQTTPSNSNSTNQSGERRAVRITNPPGSNRGAELTLIFRRDEIRRESTAAQTNNADNSRVPRSSLTPRDNATSPRTPTTLPPITAQSDTHATPTLATSSPRVAHISTSASQPNTGAIVSPPSTSSALANTAQSSPSYAATTPPTPALSTATPSAARTIPNSVARAAAPSATCSLDRPASASRSTTPAVARSVPPPMLSHPRPPAREPPNPSSNTPTFSDGEDDDSSNTSALPNGSSTLRDVMQALNGETSTTTAERTTTIRRPPPRQNSSLVANISSASRRNSSSGSRPNTEQSATTEQLYESSERPAARDSSQQNTYAPQRRFRRDSQSNRPVRASHDIDISNMNRLTNRNTTTRSRGSDRAPDGTSRPPETQRSRSQSNRRSSITAQLQRQDHRDDSPVPRPRRRSEIREELLKSRSNRE